MILSRALLCLALLQVCLSANPVRFLPWDHEIATRRIGLQSGKGLVEIRDLHPYKRSKPVAATAGAEPLLLLALDRTGSDGKPLRIGIKLAPETQSPLVIVLPDGKTHRAFVRS